jgi:3-hydroxyacyl-CoA dehydrogenase/enoyl-CoA hydratase/carnithine racemase
MAEPITVFYTQFYNSPVGKIAILTMDNGLDYKKPNVFGEKAFISLGQAIDRVKAEEGVKGLMLTGKLYIFAAGADLSQVPFISTFEQGYGVGKAGHDALKRLMEFDFPTLAAINGVALGGGLEISLYCKYRTISKSVAAVGFPECFLGLIPGWGGCTLTPKLIGPEKTLQLVIYNALKQNKMLGAKEAFELGLADRLLDSADFFDQSLAFLQGIIAGTEKVQRQPVSFEGLDALIEKAREFVDSRVHGAAPAPYRALELIKGGCTSDIDKGFDEENKALGELIRTRQCKASIYSFDLVNRYAKKPKGVPEVKPQKVSKIGVLGAGLMASQLAHFFIHRMGLPVVMKDVKQEFIDKGVAFVRAQFEKSVQKGRMNQARANYLSSLVRGTLDIADFADCDFVIEAVFEEMSVKKKVFAEAESVLKPEAILATNTSSLSVTEMASELKNPERVVGFHFFNPVALMPLIEVIRGEKTGDGAVATAFDVAKKLKKTAISVKDSPAFLVNRILLKNLCDCISIVDKGASFQQVDDAALSLGLPMAPFQLLEMTGLPIALHVNETLNKAFGDRFPISRNLKAMVEAGQKNIYAQGNGRTVAPEVEKLWVKEGNKTFCAEEIREILLESLAREADLILQEKIVAGTKDIDLAMIMGAGWPFFNGGLTMYLDLLGVSAKTLQKVFFGL